MIDPKIFKAYDIRGIYPQQIDENLAYKIGQAYCRIVKPDQSVAVGMDVRTHSSSLKKSLIDGLIDAGVDVVDLGLISTEMLYFAVGNYDYSGGIQVTASHNTAEFNGFKMTRSKAIPISSDTGILEIRDLIMDRQDRVESDLSGKVEKRDILEDFALFVLSMIDKDKLKNFKIAFNPNFGFGGEVLKKVIEVGNLNIDLVGINDTLDGTFPKGQPDPFKMENRPEFIRFVKDSRVDIGVAWDADADRVFFCTAEGEFIEPYYINTVFARHLLKKAGGGKIIYDPRYTWALIDIAKEFNGEAFLERVGHSFIKARMRKEDAIFAGESSGHTYFKDFWYADSGIIPLLILLEIISEGVSLNDLIDPIADRYFISGEINKSVSDKDVILKRIEERYHDAEISKIDGLSIEYQEWRANIRGSNTEPLLRLNIEGKSQKIVEEVKDEIIKIIDA